MRRWRSSISRSLAVRRSTPRSFTVPPTGRCSPSRCRSSVDLPEPDPPMITRISPGWTTKSMPCSTRRRPYHASSLSTSISGAPAWLTEVLMRISPSLPRKRGPSDFAFVTEKRWDPAFAGMTKCGGAPTRSSIQEERKHHVRDDDPADRQDDRTRRRAPHAYRAAADRESRADADQRNQHREYDALREALPDI